VGGDADARGVSFLNARIGRVAGRGLSRAIPEWCTTLRSYVFEEEEGLYLSAFFFLASTSTMNAAMS
jgi:hypothetical protein